MTILEAWEWYEKDKKMLKYSPHTLKAYKIQIRLLSEAISNKDINEVKYEELKGYLYTQEHLKASSLGHRIRFIRSFFRWAVDEGHIDKNPAARLREPQNGKRIPKFLNEEETETLIATCETAREYAIILFMYTTGCRIGEMVKLNIRDIDWDNGSVIVNGKGNVDREVYFNMKCKIWLKKYVESRNDKDEALFVTERSPHRLSIAQMRCIMKGVAERAGLKNVYPHRLRHSYGTHLLNAGAPMEAIRQLMGHAKASTTALYAELSGEKRKEFYKKYF